MRHRTTAELESRLDHLRASPPDIGSVEMVVCRPADGVRSLLDEGVLDLELGLVGDNWSTRPSGSSADGGPHPDKQVTVMNHRMVSLLAELPEEQALAGDQLYVDLDLSVENLPAGTRLAVGTAVIEVTEPPHAGCGIFLHHFGADAMRFVNGRLGRPLRLRGLNARVVTPGTVRPGDKAVKLPG